MAIGGNIEAIMQQKTDGGVNAIGERLELWSNLATLTGWLDFVSGEARYTYNAKLQESTHVFLCDYVPLDKEPENKRLIVDGHAYDVLLIDDPMNMHQHLEIMLKLIGRCC